MEPIEWERRASSDGWEMKVIHRNGYRTWPCGPCGVYPPREANSWITPGWCVWRAGEIVSETYDTPEEAKAMAVALYRLGELT